MIIKLFIGLLLTFTQVPPVPKTCAAKIARNRPALKIARNRPALKIARNRPALKIARNRPALKIARNHPALKIACNRPALKIARNRPTLKIARNHPALKIARNRPALKMSFWNQDTVISRMLGIQIEILGQNAEIKMFLLSDMHSTVCVIDKYSNSL